MKRGQQITTQNLQAAFSKENTMSIESKSMHAGNTQFAKMGQTGFS